MQQRAAQCRSVQLRVRLRQTWSLKWHEHRSSWSLLLVKNSSVPPFPDWLNFVHYAGKKLFLNFAALWGQAFDFNIFIKVMNLMWHLFSIREPYKFKFLFIEWRIPEGITFAKMEFWGVGDLYLSVERGGGMMIGLRERWSCQLHAGPQKLFSSILSHRGTCALHEYDCALLKYHPYGYERE